jgi:hypothetical protein
MRLLLLSFLFVFFGSTLAAQEDDTSSLNCPVDFAGHLAPRLVVDEWARVLETPLNFRPTPGTQQARLDQLAPGRTVQITGGPVCSEGYVWWQTHIAGAAGWLAEGSFTESRYWLEPRGRLVREMGMDDVDRLFALSMDGAAIFMEPADCQRPPEDYTLEQLGYATLNRRTLFMLDQAQRAYNGLRPDSRLVNFRQLIAQGSYNTGGVAASFGTHDAGGAVDISVRSPVDWSVMETEMPYMIEALRIAGFAAWVRETGSLYPDSPIHIHAIAVGDAELSPAARLQIDSERGYLHGYNGLPEDYGAQPIPDNHGGPVICRWMWEDGWGDMRNLKATTFADMGRAAHDRRQYAHAVIAYREAIERDPVNWSYLLTRSESLTELELHEAALDDIEAILVMGIESADLYRRAGDLAHLMEDYELAIQYYTTGLGKSPDDAALHRARGHSHYHAEQYEPALADYTGYISLTGDTNDSIINQRIAEIVAGIEGESQ